MTDEEMDRLEPVAEQLVQAVHRGDADTIRQFWENHTFNQIGAIAVMLASIVPRQVSLRAMRAVAELPTSHELDDWPPEAMQLAHEEYVRQPFNHPPSVVIGEMLFQQYQRAEVLQVLSPTVDGLGAEDGIPA